MIHENNIFLNQKLIKVTDFGLNLISNIVINETEKINQSKKKEEKSKFKKIKYDIKRIGLLTLKLMTCSKNNRLNIKNIKNFDEIGDDSLQIDELLKRLPKVYGKDLKELLQKMISNKIEEIPYPEDIIQIKWNRNVSKSFLNRIINF